MNKFFFLTIISIALLSSCSTDDISATTIDLETNSTAQTLEVATADFKIDNVNSQLMEKDGLIIINNSLNAKSYHWDFGNGDTSTEANPTYSYDLHGYFTVKLTITDSNGNEEETSHYVEVLCPFEGQNHAGSN